jgi:sugar transferase (PEP-CTERM/EpsH1 system associated)
MNVLWLNAGLLLPLDKGGKLRTWHLMRHLARRHHISYLSFADPSASAATLDGMLDVCRSLETVPRRDPPKGTWRFRLDAARYIPQRVPYAIAKYRSAAYRQRVSDLVRHKRFDVIVCDFLVPLVNLPEDLPCPTVLFTHNVEAEIWRRHAATAAHPLTRTLLRQQWGRMVRFEGRALARCDLVLAVSHADVATFSRLYAGAARRPMHVVQTGVDTEYFSPRPAPPRPAHLVFTGSMDWLPNEDAMLHFVHDVLPRIRAVEPSVTLSIVGRDPTPTVRQLADHAGIEVTGRVDDVRPDIARSRLYVVPLRIGGGTRLKIFEAMAMGRAVVSTTIGAEGLPVTSGRDIVIADGPDAFARAVVDLIRDHDRRRRIEAGARQLVVDGYDWCAAAQNLEQALTTVACEPAGASLSLRMERSAMLPAAPAINNIGKNQGPR